MPEANEPTKEQIFWILVTSYIGQVVGLLDQKTKARLDGLFRDQPGNNWPAQVEAALDIDAPLIRGIYALCTERKPAHAAIGFILRGLGCPPEEVESRVRELVVAKT